MSTPADPTENEDVANIPVEKTRDDGNTFEPITPDGVDTGKPAVTDPQDSQNPPPRRG